jgi:uncharacterized protein (TIGR03000 family)
LDVGLVFSLGGCDAIDGSGLLPGPGTSRGSSGRPGAVSSSPVTVVLITGAEPGCLGALILANPSQARADLPVSTEAMAQPASLHVRVPADAEMWFEGNKTTQDGLSRRFVTPPLRAGDAYVYRVRVRWLDGGQPIDVTRQVLVSAGDQIELDFIASRTVELRVSYVGADAATATTPPVRRTSSSPNGPRISGPALPVPPLSGMGNTNFPVLSH